MKRRTFLAASVVGFAGCSDSNDPQTTDGQSGDGGVPDVSLTSIGQDTTEDETAVLVSGSVKNYGTAPQNVTTVVTLYNGTTPVAEKKIPVGDLQPDESASFETVLDVDPSRVDSRTVSFE